METKVLVTGATGSIGSNAIKRLLEFNIPVRALVHKLDGRSDALIARGVEVVAGDMTDFKTVSAAMKGVTGVLFIFPIIEGLLEATTYFAQAALEENVGHFVNISQRTAVRDAPSHSAQSHWLAERLLDRSGVSVTHLQPTLFMDWLLYFAQEIREHNRYITPFGSARFGIIDSNDIGRVAAAILAKPEGHAGKTYQIYGQSELTGYNVAEQLSDALKRKVTYYAMPPEAFGEIMSAASAQKYQVKHIVAVGHMFDTGEFVGMNDNVEMLSGTKPISVADFIAKNITLFG